MNYKHLYYFLQVAKLGGVLRASERLHLSPQAISGQVQLLEEAFGTPLFDLANLSSNGGFDEAQDRALLAAYFDGPVPAELRAAFDAMKAASLLREALWALVSDRHLKTEGVDYRAHAKEYLGRLSSMLAKL